MRISSVYYMALIGYIIDLFTGQLVDIFDDKMIL